MDQGNASEMATRNGTSVDPIEPLKTSLLEQILGWSEQSLPDWQRDALRRLFQHWSTELAPADFAELFSLMKKNNGIAILGELVAKPWAKEHLPNTAANNQHAILTAMHKFDRIFHRDDVVLAVQIGVIDHRSRGG